MSLKNLFFFITTVILNYYEVKSIIPPSSIINVSEVPFMAYVSNNRSYCGGVILSENIVLTASHCIDGDLEVSAGRSHIYLKNNAQTIPVQYSMPHENYLLAPNEVQAYNDIGLLLLQTPFTFNEYVQPIQLADNVAYEESAFVIGFGSTDAFQNRPSYRLRARNISLIPDDLCVEMLNKTTKCSKCTKQKYEICAEKGVCIGDSGGPLLQKVGSLTKLIGIASWAADDTFNCNTEPTVFADVGYFSQWIKDGMNELLKRKEIQVDSENGDTVQTTIDQSLY